MDVVLHRARELTKQVLQNNHPNAVISSDPDESDLRVGTMGKAIVVHGRLAAGDIYEIKEEINSHLDYIVSYKKIDTDYHEFTLESSS